MTMCNVAPVMKIPWAKIRRRGRPFQIFKNYMSVVQLLARLRDNGDDAAQVCDVFKELAQLAQTEDGPRYQTGILDMTRQIYHRSDIHNILFLTLQPSLKVAGSH